MNPAHEDEYRASGRPLDGESQRDVAGGFGACGVSRRLGVAVSPGEARVLAVIATGGRSRVRR
jgi:hypothetical protein